MSECIVDNETSHRFPLKVVALSQNSKIGPAAATYRPVGDTCPQDCFFLNNGCYAQRGNTAIRARNSAQDFHDLDRALAKGVRLIRHHVSGDFFKNNMFDREYFDYVMDWHRANRKMQGYAYTHRILDIIDAGITAADMPSNFSLMASLDAGQDTPENRDRIREAGFRYARVVDSYDEAFSTKDKQEVPCPNQVAKMLGKKTITCSECQLCTHGRTDVIFIRH